jgi:hypothetical protein
MTFWNNGKPRGEATIVFALKYSSHHKSKRGSEKLYSRGSVTYKVAVLD